MQTLLLGEIAKLCSLFEVINMINVLDIVAIFKHQGELP